MLARSFLYVPGDRPDRLEKALIRAGDAVIADLEDAVAPASKDRALDHVRSWLGDLPAAHPQVWVRINTGPRCADEVAALREAPNLAGILLPKADLASTRAILYDVDRRWPVAALVESARGVLDAPAVAALPGVSHLGIGEADLTSELALTPSDDERELIPLRMGLVVASAAAGLPAPTGPVSLDVRDPSALRTSTEALKRLGFGSRSAIHPDQVGVIEEVFTPTAAEAAAARELVASYDEVVASGTGVVVDARGRMVDEAVVRAARRTVERADALSA